MFDVAPSFFATSIVPHVYCTASESRSGSLPLLAEISASQRRWFAWTLKSSHFGGYSGEGSPYLRAPQRRKKKIASRITLDHITSNNAHHQPASFFCPSRLFLCGAHVLTDTRRTNEPINHKIGRSAFYESIDYPADEALASAVEEGVASVEQASG